MEKQEIIEKEKPQPHQTTVKITETLPNKNLSQKIAKKVKNTQMEKWINESLQKPPSHTAQKQKTEETKHPSQKSQKTTHKPQEQQKPTKQHPAHATKKPTTGATQQPTAKKAAPHLPKTKNQEADYLTSVGNIPEKKALRSPCENTCCSFSGIENV